MNTEINQKISSFLDNDLNSYDEEKLLLKMSKDPELINKLTRYQTVRHVLKQDEFVTVKPGFLDKIKQEIDQEPHFFMPKQKVKKRQFGLWQKTSVAMAACTVLAVILFSQNSELNLENNIAPNVLATSDVSVVPQQVVATKSTTAKSTEAKTQSLELDKVTTQEDVEFQLASDYKKIQHERLKAYLQAHSDNSYAYDNSVNAQPYASVVSQE
ncbi:MAG: sigma-E factor negative regulatory protein [Methylococcaceae bacterium]|nr:sigma-E factor negative regulatory protein [Methylococcaceae bacterium]